MQNVVQTIRIHSKQNSTAATWHLQDTHGSVWWPKPQRNMKAVRNVICVTGHLVNMRIKYGSDILMC